LLQVKDLAPTGLVDFAINESCSEYTECKLYRPFQEAGIPVFNVEYSKAAFDRLCGLSGTVKGIRSIFKSNDLKAVPRAACPGQP
jgi:hypothetical protein